MRIVYKNIHAITMHTVATLVDVISTIPYNNMNEERIKIFEDMVKNKEDVVIIPIEYSIEHYREKQDKIASYCQYSAVAVDEENKKLNVSYNCLNRCKIVKIDIINNSIYVDIELLDRQQFLPEHEKLRNDIFERFKEYLKYDNVNVATIEAVKNAKDIDFLIQEIAVSCRFEVQAKRKLLEELDATKRLEILNSELETRIYEQKSDKGQNTFAYYKDKINELNLSADVKRIVYDELTRLKTTRPGQAEYGNIVDWLDRLVALPWQTVKEENKDIEYAKKVLDESHYGMEKIKQKILDYIALRLISGKNQSQIMCLYGPPGVGKSTIVKSIAKALNKDYFNFSLGGISVPEEIVGMKRFFLGAKPGRIMEGITQAGSKNCIILLDEIDKMSQQSNRGDPYSVLLEILDRNQNKEFKDRYFDVPFDLSQVMFIATANDITAVPEPLKNRMEIINIEGYSLNEKVHIAKEYILKRTLKEIGVDENLVTIQDKTLQTIIEDYTFESGVRQLERALNEICKKYLIGLQMKNLPIAPKEITLDEAREFLGEDYYEEDYNLAFEGEVGVVNKLSVSGSTGSVSRLEIALVKGNGEQILSDNLVGTAKWTFKTVFGLVKSKCKEWEIDPAVFENSNFYIHSPHHAVSHDGPSGGVADVLCLISAIKEIPINYRYAFTGEISLKGKVLAIGGIKEKLLAAQRNKIETVIVPLKNRKDIEKLSSEIVGDMNIKYVDNIEEAYNFVFKEIN